MALRASIAFSAVGSQKDLDMTPTSTDCKFTEYALSQGVPFTVISDLRTWDRAYLRNTYRDKPELVAAYMDHCTVAIDRTLHSLDMPSEMSERLWLLALTEVMPKLDVFEWELEQDHAPGYGNFQLEHDMYGYVGCVIAQGLEGAGVDLPHNLMAKYLPRAMQHEAHSLILDDASSELAEFIIDLSVLHNHVCCPKPGQPGWSVSEEQYDDLCRKFGWQLIELSHDPRFADFE